MNPLHELNKQGQSVWLDFISRELIKTGQLKKLIKEDSVTGMTSNPTIFEKAIAAGHDYDAQLKKEAARGLTPYEIFEELSIADIRDLVCELKKRDIGVLITDHNVRETLDIVDRACIIYDGQVLFEGTPQALVADENVRRLYLGESFAL